MANKVSTASRESRTTKPIRSEQYIKPLKPVVALENALFTSRSKADTIRRTSEEAPSAVTTQEGPPKNDAATTAPGNRTQRPGACRPAALLKFRNSSIIAAARRPAIKAKS